MRTEVETLRGVEGRGAARYFGALRESFDAEWASRAATRVIRTNAIETYW